MVAARTVETRWSFESAETCLEELARRSRLGCEFRAGRIRKSIVAEEPRAGAYVQCFRDSLTGFADWALLEESNDGLRAVVRAGREAARFSFVEEPTRVFTLGVLLEKYSELRVNNTEAPRHLFSDDKKQSWRDSPVCYAELCRRLDVNERGYLAPMPGDRIVAVDGSGKLVVTLEKGWSCVDDTGRSISLGAMLDDYDILLRYNDADDSKRRLPILRPPRQRPQSEEDSSSCSSSSSDVVVVVDRALEKVALELFTSVYRPGALLPRRERCKIEAAAMEEAAKVVKVDEDEFYAWATHARYQGGLAKKPLYAGEAAETLDEALRQHARRHPDNPADVPPAVAVAAYIASKALADRETSAGASIAWLSGSFNDVYSEEQEAAAAVASSPDFDDDDEVVVVEKTVASDSAVRDAQACIRAGLEAVLRYHPRLAHRRDWSVACAEAVDRRFFSEERRYEAVMGAISAGTQANDAHFAASVKKQNGSDRPSVVLLRSLPTLRTAGQKTKALVACLGSLASEISGDRGGDDLMPALCDAVADAGLAQPHAELAFATLFCRDEQSLLGADGYALTSFEIALSAILAESSAVRPDDLVNMP